MSDELTIDQLTKGELEDLERLGRIQDGKILPAAAPVVNALPASAPQLLPVSDIPSMPEGVKERLQSLDELKSSFVATNEKGEVKRSDDNGKEVEEQIKEVNPDWATRPAEDKVEAADKAAYLAHILGAPFFEKSYPLFGGALTVTFRTLTQAKVEQCTRQAWNDDKLDGKVGRDGSAEADAGRIGRFQMYKFVAELYSTTRTGSLKKIYNPFEDFKGDLESGVWPIRQAWESLQKETSSPVLVAIRQAHYKFEKLVAQLTLSADKPDFWKADSGT